MSFRVLGIPHLAAVALSREQRRGVGEVHFQEVGVGQDRYVDAVREDPVTVIDVTMLDWVRAGSVRRMSVDGNRVVLDMANGHWEYEIGEYRDEYVGYMLTLVLDS